jgi:hypothetical protein
MKISGVKGLSEVFTLVNNNLNVFVFGRMSNCWNLSLLSRNVSKR